MQNVIKIEKEKLLMIINIARTNVDINLEDLLKLASVEIEENKKEVDQESEQSFLELEPEPVKKVPKKLTKKRVSRKKWTTNEETDFIKMVESKVDYGYISKKLNRTVGALYNKAHELRDAGRLTDFNNEYENSNKPYSESDLKLLDEVYRAYGEVSSIPDRYFTVLGKRIGRSSEAVRTRMYHIQEGDK